MSKCQHLTDRRRRRLSKYGVVANSHRRNHPIVLLVDLVASLVLHHLLLVLHHSHLHRRADGFLRRTQGGDGESNNSVLLVRLRLNLVRACVLGDEREVDILPWRGGSDVERGGGGFLFGRGDPASRSSWLTGVLRLLTNLKPGKHAWTRMKVFICSSSHSRYQRYWPRS